MGNETIIYVAVLVTERLPKEFATIHIVLIGGSLPLMAQWRPAEVVTTPPTGEWWGLGMGEAKPLEDKKKCVTHWLEARLESSYLKDRFEEMMKEDEKRIILT